MCPLMCPHRWQPLQQLRAGLGGDPPVPGSASNPKDTMVRRPGRRRIVNGTRTVTWGTGIVMLSALPTPGRPPGCQAPPPAAGCQRLSGQRSSAAEGVAYGTVTGFRISKDLIPTRARIHRISVGKGRVSAFSHLARDRFLRRVAIIKVTELCLMNLLDYASLG